MREPRIGTHRILGLVGLIALAAALAGCGYALVGRASSLPEDIQEIHIEPLRNQTPRSQVDLILTQALTNEFVTRRRFTVVDNPSEADAELRGVVQSFTVRPVTFNEDGRASEYEILINAAVTFERVGANPDDDPIWARDNYLFRENYELDEGATNFTALEDAAIEEAADKFAESLVIEVLEGF